MSNKKQTVSKHENEIEKLRNENKWDKLKEYSNNLLKNKDSKYECLAKLCIGEADLERYLIFTPLFCQIESNNNYIVDTDLANAEKYLNNVVQKFDKENYSTEAQILLSKLYYSQNRYKDALNSLLKTKINIKNQPSIKSLNLRQIQLYAEAYSLKGLCLEQQHKTTTSQPATQTQDNRNFIEIINYFQLSSDLAVEHSQTLATLRPDDNSDDLMNPLFEVALQKTPLLFIKMGDILNGLKKFRDLLLKRHIQSIISIRQCLLKKFSECLLNSVCVSNYVPFNNLNLKNEKLFIPMNLDEETLLCLVLSQYLACKEVMLLRQPQYKQTREYSYNNAIASVDLLIFYLTYRKSYSILLEKFESTMKFSFEQFYVWYQYGLNLMCAEKYQKAYLVFKECNRMKPDHVTCVLLLAQLAVQHLFLVNEAIEWSKLALDLTNNTNVKAHILHGCACIKKYHLEKQYQLKLTHLEHALESFKSSHEIDRFNYVSLYHLSHTYALLRRITEAIECVNGALKLRNDDKDCLHLLALLLTSTKNYDEAYTVISKACLLYDDFELLYTKARIEEQLYGFNECMNSLVRLILVYRKKVQSLDNIHHTIANKTRNSGLDGTITASSNNYDVASSIGNLQNTIKLNEAIGKTITMLLQTDQFLYKYTQTNATGTNGTIVNNGTHPATVVTATNSNTIIYLLQLIRVLSEICEFYLRHRRVSDAESCCYEICSLHPMSYLSMYLKGRIYQYKGDFVNAKTCFTNALSINPYHIQSLEQFSRVLYELGNYSLAEKMIRDAITINNSLPQLWSQLGLILDAQQDSESSIKCYQTALQLESTNPIVPFSNLTKIL